MMYEIDFIQFLYKLKKRGWLIVYITLICMMIAGIYSFFIVQPLYESNVSIIIGKGEARYFLEDGYTNSDVSLYLQVAKTYEEIAESRMVWDRVEESLKDEGLKEIENIKVASKSGTQIITITVSHPSSKNVAIYANAFAEQFIQVADEMLPAGELRILDKAEQPKTQASPNRILNMAISVLFGLILSVVIIFLSEYFNPIIELEQDVVDCFNLPILGVLPREKIVAEERYVI